MTYEVYRYIFYGGMILSCLMLIASVVLFFVLKIPNVIGDLTGANARKAIEEIRNQNQQTGTKTYKPSAVNRERGKVTDKITSSGRLMKNPTNDMGGHKTAKISTQQLDTEMLPADETTVLSDASSETTVLQEPAGETTVLDTAALDTTALDTTVLDTTVLPAMMQQPAVFAIELDITYIHTNEVIS